MQGLNLSQPGLKHDPEWFKTAVFYEVLVRGFGDSNGSGAGDFTGLIDRLDYLAWLGVDCLWLPPFYASPLRDGGYDIADYTAGAARVRHAAGLPGAGLPGARPRHPDHHRLRHEPHQRPAPVVPGVALRPRGPVRRLLRLVRHRRAVLRRPHHLHRHRGLQLDLRPDPAAVLLAPVLLATSPTSTSRTRPSTRRCSTSSGSGWTWASTASGSTRSPTSTRRRATTARTTRRPTSSSPSCARWSTRSTPGGSCSPRPTSRRPTSWTTSAPSEAPECQMCFHFPVMPMLYYSLREEKAAPIIDVLADTPAIPPGTQWGTFLRNHDELTLEMVTPEQRAAMYGWYAPDPRMRANVGIRRRLVAAAGQQPRRDRADPRPAAVAARVAVPLLRRRDRHGRQHLAQRPRRGPHADAVDPRPQRRASPPPTPASSTCRWSPRSSTTTTTSTSRPRWRSSSSLLHWVRAMLEIRKRHPVFGLGDFEVCPSRQRRGPVLPAGRVGRTRAARRLPRRCCASTTCREPPQATTVRVPDEFTGRPARGPVRRPGLPEDLRRRHHHADPGLARLLLAPAGAGCRPWLRSTTPPSSPTKLELRRPVDGAPALVCRQGPAPRCCARSGRGGSTTPPARSASRPSSSSDEGGSEPVVYQVPLTYRGAPLEGGQHALVGTMEHSVLGRRWVYDGPHDPVYAAQLLALVLEQAHPAGRRRLRHPGAGGRRPSGTRRGRPQTTLRGRQGAVRRAVQHLHHLRLRRRRWRAEAVDLQGVPHAPGRREPRRHRPGRAVRGRVDRACPTMVGTVSATWPAVDGRRAGVGPPRLRPGVLPRHRGRLAGGAASGRPPARTSPTRPASSGPPPPRCTPCSPRCSPPRPCQPRGDRRRRWPACAAATSRPPPRCRRWPPTSTGSPPCSTTPSTRAGLRCNASTATTTSARCSRSPAAAGCCSTSRASPCGRSPSAACPTSPCATSPACSARSTTPAGSWEQSHPGRQRPRLGRGRPAGLPRRVCRGVRA